jgi:hypothetical protein
MNKHKMKPMKTSNTIRVLSIPAGLAHRTDAQLCFLQGLGGFAVAPLVQLINGELPCHC